MSKVQYMENGRLTCCLRLRIGVERCVTGTKSIIIDIDAAEVVVII